MSTGTPQRARRRIAGALVLLVLMGGCAVEIPRTVPTVAMETIGALGDPTSTAVDGATSPPDGWWRLFDDPMLDSHIVEALRANADLRIAVANLEIARAVARQASAGRLPATVVESGVGPDRADRQPSTSSVPKTSYELGFTVAYEVDLFGRVEAGARAAEADGAAAEAMRDAAMLAVIADTVAAYLDLCGATASSRLAARQVETQQNNLRLVAARLESGEVSPLELNQAQLLLERVTAGVPQFDADRKRAAYQLKVLRGEIPASTAQDFRCDVPPRIVRPLPIGDGAAMLARRPDVREAEHRLRSALARLDLAQAEIYPRIQLGGSAGLIAGGTDAFLTPLITWAFPNQTAVRARTAAAQGDAAVALASWDKTILNALGEVQTALADYQAESERLAILTNSAQEAQMAAKRAESRVRLGADSSLLVLDAERTRIDTENQVAQSRLRLSQIQVALFRSLGGGWQQPQAR
ncbi:MAG: TolC family protein [Pseudomonadota bacterium]